MFIFFSKPKPIEELLPFYEKNKLEVIHPIVDLSRPIEEQIQLFPTDKVKVYGSKPALVKVWFGSGWFPFEYDLVYMVQGPKNKPLTPKFQGIGRLKLEVTITKNKDKKREL